MTNKTLEPVELHAEMKYEGLLDPFPIVKGVSELGIEEMSRLKAHWNAHPRLNIGISNDPVYISTRALDKYISTVLPATNRGSREVGFHFLEKNDRIWDLEIGPLGDFGRVSIFGDDSSDGYRTIQSEANSTRGKRGVGHTHPPSYGPIFSHVDGYAKTFDQSFEDDYFGQQLHFRGGSIYHLVGSPDESLLGVMEWKPKGKIVYHPWFVEDAEKQEPETPKRIIEEITKPEGLEEVEQWQRKKKGYANGRHSAVLIEEPIGKGPKTYEKGSTPPVYFSNGVYGNSPRTIEKEFRPLFRSTATEESKKELNGNYQDAFGKIHAEVIEAYNDLIQKKNSDGTLKYTVEQAFEIARGNQIRPSDQYLDEFYAGHKDLREWGERGYDAQEEISKDVKHISQEEKRTEAARLSRNLSAIAADRKSQMRQIEAEVARENTRLGKRFNDYKRRHPVIVLPDLPEYDSDVIKAVGIYSADPSHAAQEVSRAYNKLLEAGKKDKAGEILSALSNYFAEEISRKNLPIKSSIDMAYCKTSSDVRLGQLKK